MKTKTFLILILLLLFMSAGFIPLSTAAAQSPNVYTTVVLTNITSGAPVVGGTFTTDLHLSVANNATPAVGIMGAEVWLRYNPTTLAVNDADDNPANGIQVKIRQDFFGSALIVAANEVAACPGGQGECIHLALSHTGSPITNRSGAVATITWAGKAQGDAGLAILPETILSDANGQPVTVNSVTAPTIAVMPPGVIHGQVLRQGSRAGHNGTTVTAYSTTGSAVASTTTAADGSFDLSVPLGGAYLIQAAYPGYLKAQRNNVTIVGATVDMGSVTLRGGDVNSDNNVNILDITAISGRYGTTGWPPAEPADINDDGTINLYDLTITSGNFGRYGPQAW